MQGLGCKTAGTRGRAPRDILLPFEVERRKSFHGRLFWLGFSGWIFPPSTFGSEEAASSTALILHPGAQPR